MIDNFIPEDYSLPAVKGGYLKLEKGETRFRFISSPIMGYVYWIKGDDQKDVPKRVRDAAQVPSQFKSKYFWAAIVWDYVSESLKILEITQKTVLAPIVNLIKNPKWGSPKEYDLCITREGDGMQDTVYQVFPEPKTPVPESAPEDAKKIHLEVLFDGGDPFTPSN